MSPPQQHTRRVSPAVSPRSPTKDFFRRASPPKAKARILTNRFPRKAWGHRFAPHAVLIRWRPSIARWIAVTHGLLPAQLFFASAAILCAPAPHGAPKRAKKGPLARSAPRPPRFLLPQCATPTQLALLYHAVQKKLASNPAAGTPWRLARFGSVRSTRGLQRGALCTACGFT